jgi:hypothetical protein
MWRTFPSKLDDQGRLDWSESFLDGTLRPVFYSFEGNQRGNSSKMGDFHGFAEIDLEM